MVSLKPNWPQVHQMMEDDRLFILQPPTSWENSFRYVHKQACSTQFLQRLYHVSVTAWIMYQLVVFNVTTQILILSSSITWLGVIVCLLFKGCVPKDHTGTEAKIYVSLWTHLKGSELMAGGCRSTFHTCGRQWGQRSRTEHQAGEEAHSTLGVNSEDSIAASFLWRNKSL